MKKMLVLLLTLFVLAGCGSTQEAVAAEASVSQSDLASARESGYQEGYTAALEECSDQITALETQAEELESQVETLLAQLDTAKSEYSSNLTAEYDKGYSEGYSAGQAAAEDAVTKAAEEELSASYTSGYETGYAEGYASGYRTGASDRKLQQLPPRYPLRRLAATLPHPH